MSIADRLDFSKSPDRLIPAVAQDAATREILMVAYVNKAALERAVELGEAVYFSRSRQALWHKGETSGNVQKLRDILVDCDGDCVIYLVEPAGPACHTGNRTCFFRRLNRVSGELENV